MASRAAKRFKIHQPSTTSSSFVSDFKRGEDDYLPGNIFEIEIHNFMTYDHLTCRPASRLNLVIGPNGSGKSSLVCAIALGLAGEPQILGRAASIGAFVKRGEEKGYVKISLRGFTADEMITIQRKIDVHNRSDWTINGATATRREVIEIIQKFNIQVNNLTQFLPQDRVCEFAKLTPIQLLEETEKAVGDPQLPVQHRALVDKSYELKKLEVTVKQNRETFNQLKALNAEQEKDVERVRQRNQLLAKADLMKKKLPWLRYDKKKAEYKGFQKRETEAKKKFDMCAQFLSQLKVPIEEKKKIKVMHEASTKKINHQISENAKKRSELLEMEAKMGVQIRAKYKEMDEFKKQEETRQKRIIKAKEDLIIAERELEELPVYELPREKLENLRVQILELENSASQITMQATEKEHLLKQKKITLRQNIERLKEMENNNNKLLQALKRSGAEKIFEVYNWLQEHRSELRKEVYGPVLLEVTVNNRSHATYLENHVPNYIWKSIITQDPADRDFLVRNLKGYDVPILNYLEDRGDNLSPFHMTREMHDLGIQSRLDQVFDAPRAVKNVLVSQAMLDKSYIGSNETDRRADEVTKLGIMDLWTPESHYRWTKSRYGGHVSASVNPVQQSRLFMCSIDVSNLENLKSKTTDLESTIAELEESLKHLVEERRQLENETAPLHKERENIHQQNNEAKKKRRDMENRVDQRRRMLQSLMGEEDLNSVADKLIELVAQLNDKRFQLATKVKTLLIEAVGLKWKLAEKHLMSIEFDALIREMEADLKQQEKEALNATTQYENCKNEAEDCRRQLASAKQHAESIARLTSELKQEFEEMPATIEELEAAIQDNISEAYSILFLNQNILQEYESRQRQIEAMATKLETDEQELNRCLSDIDTLKGSWLPTLRNLVAKINETFSRNFQEMAVAGEVTLDEHETDFDKYGIHIKVKFRESGQLQVLSAYHQSGGERSVSTILYLVSLQDLTNCPFRVVDEINQGMDPINERKMFQQLVRAASQQNTPQCFLLTPKLLPDLEYSPACSILNIMNGPYIEKPSQAWSRGGSWGMIMSSIRGSL